MNSTLFPWYAYAYPDNQRHKLFLCMIKTIPNMQSGIERLRAMYAQIQVEDRLSLIKRIQNATKASFASVVNTFELYNDGLHYIRMFNRGKHIYDLKINPWVRVHDELIYNSLSLDQVRFYRDEWANGLD